METIGEKIKRIRKSKGISQFKVATICGIKQSSIANIEGGITSNITIEIGKGIAKALEMNFNELFDIEVQKTEDKEIAEYVSKIQNLHNEIEVLNLKLKERESYSKSLEFESKLMKNRLVRLFVDSYNLQIATDLLFFDAFTGVDSNEESEKFKTDLIDRINNLKNVQKRYISENLFTIEDIDQYVSDLNKVGLPFKNINDIDPNLIISDRTDFITAKLGGMVSLINLNK